MSEEKSLLSQVKLYIEQYGDSQFPSATEETSYRINIKAGWKMNDKLPRDDYHLLVLPQVFKDKICAGYRARFAIDTLIKNQILISDKSGPSQVVHIAVEKCAHRVYRIDFCRWNSNSDFNLLVLG